MKLYSKHFQVKLINFKFSVEQFFSSCEEKERTRKLQTHSLKIKLGMKRRRQSFFVAFPFLTTLHNTTQYKNQQERRRRQKAFKKTDEKLMMRAMKWPMHYIALLVLVLVCNMRCSYCVALVFDV